MSEDPDMAAMVDDLADEEERLEEQIRSSLVPRDPLDSKDVIVEIRSAAGGDEAAIWAGDLLRMYERYADRHGFKIEAMDTSPSEAGGYDKVTVAVKGRDAYSMMKYEAGSRSTSTPTM
jgi:peptide chain release factor 1